MRHIDTIYKKAFSAASKYVGEIKTPDDGSILIRHGDVCGSFTIDKDGVCFAQYGDLPREVLLDAKRNIENAEHDPPRNMLTALFETELCDLRREYINEIASRKLQGVAPERRAEALDEIFLYAVHDLFHVLGYAVLREAAAVAGLTVTTDVMKKDGEKLAKQTEDRQAGGKAAHEKQRLVKEYAIELFDRYPDKNDIDGAVDKFVDEVMKYAKDKQLEGKSFTSRPKTTRLMHGWFKKYKVNSGY